MRWGTPRPFGRPLHDDKSKKTTSGFLALARRHRPDGDRRRVVPDISGAGRAGSVSAPLRDALTSSACARPERRQARTREPHRLGRWGSSGLQSPRPIDRRRRAPLENPQGEHRAGRLVPRTLHSVRRAGSRGQPRSRWVLKKAQQHQRYGILEASPGIEPGCKDLQSSA